MNLSNIGNPRKNHSAPKLCSARPLLVAPHKCRVVWNPAGFNFVQRSNVAADSTVRLVNFPPPHPKSPLPKKNVH